jgi:GT2 family glycosyltransferase
VEQASGEFVLLLNNDTEPVTPDWIEQLVLRATLPGVGAVAPLLVYPDGSVQHAGVVLGMRGTADHIMRRFPSESDGYAGSLACDREVSAVTAACMLTHRGLFKDLGGLSEWYAVHYQDVDLCLRIQRAGKRILFTPRATVMHHEGASRGTGYDTLDRALLLDVWGDVIRRGDRYYNANLSLEEGRSYVPVLTASK